MALDQETARVAPRQYPDLQTHLARLEAAGLLYRVSRPINKDTEMHPLVRWQLRGGIPETERKAFLFENVTDSKGRRYEIPVVVGGLAGSRRIYGLAIGLEDLDGIDALWARAETNQVAPVEIPSAAAPVHEVVFSGQELDVPWQGVDHLPVPISTPGWDNAPYVTAAHWITRDPDTGQYNIGNYRSMIKGQRRVGMNSSIELSQGIYQHFLKYKQRKEPMPAVLSIGGPPCISFVSMQRLDADLDEYHVAGGLVQAPIRVVQARTVPLLVPADAELLVEGYINTEWLEPEAPFGEGHGYINPQEYNCFMDVTAITHRRRPVLTSIISQVAPNESSCITRVAWELPYLRHLHRIGIKSALRVHFLEPLSRWRHCIIQFKRGALDADVWRAMFACLSFRAGTAKMVIAIDEDIDPENPHALFWAMAYRSTPHRDVQVVRGQEPGHGPRHEERGVASDSAVLWDARVKGTFPPVALPKRDFMEHAAQIWAELGLPALQPESPWFGYSLGEWNSQLDEEAAMATRSEYFTTSAQHVERRVRVDDVPMNSSVFWK